MREVNFTNEELKDAIRGNFIAAGSEASIYKYKKYVAIRLYDVGDDSVFCPVTGKMVGRPACERLIKNLHVYKDNVKLSSFPIGIVKVNDVVVGQLIKYYKNSITLTDFFKSSPSVDPMDYYMKVLDILEELALNGIAYDDVYDKLVIPSEIKGSYENLEESFDQIRELLRNLKKEDVRTR